MQVVVILSKYNFHDSQKKTFCCGQRLFLQIGSKKPAVNISNFTATVLVIPTFSALAPPEISSNDDQHASGPEANRAKQTTETRGGHKTKRGTRGAGSVGCAERQRHRREENRVKNRTRARKVCCTSLLFRSDYTLKLR